jgi:hypothetical protein
MLNYINKVKLTKLANDLYSTRKLMQKLAGQYADLRIKSQKFVMTIVDKLTKDNE